MNISRVGFSLGMRLDLRQYKNLCHNKIKSQANDHQARENFKRGDDAGREEYIAKRQV